MKRFIAVLFALAMMLNMSSCALIAFNYKVTEETMSDKNENTEESLQEKETADTTAVPADIVEALKNGVPQEMINAGIEELLENPHDVWDGTSTETITLSNIKYECAFYFDGSGRTDRSIYLVYHMDVDYELEGYESASGSIYHAVEFDEARLNGFGIIEYEDIDSDCYNGSMESLRIYQTDNEHVYVTLYRFGQESVDDLYAYYEQLFGENYEIIYIP